MKKVVDMGYKKVTGCVNDGAKEFFEGTLLSR